MVFFLFVAILNLGLGYGLALYLHGAGGPLPWASGRRWSLGLRFLSLAKDSDEELDEPAGNLSEKAVAKTSSPSADAAVADDSAAVPQSFI